MAHSDLICKPCRQRGNQWGYKPVLKCNLCTIKRKKKHHKLWKMRHVVACHPTFIPFPYTQKLAKCAKWENPLRLYNLKHMLKFHTQYQNAYIKKAAHPFQQPFHLSLSPFPIKLWWGLWKMCSYFKKCINELHRHKRPYKRILSRERFIYNHLETEA